MKDKFNIGDIVRVTSITNGDVFYIGKIGTNIPIDKKRFISKYDYQVEFENVPARKTIYQFFENELELYEKKLTERTTICIRDSNLLKWLKKNKEK
jgi:hypothetical protein